MPVQATQGSEVQAYNASSVQARIDGPAPPIDPADELIEGIASLVTPQTTTFDPCPITGATAQDAVDEVLGGTGRYRMVGATVPNVFARLETREIYVATNPQGTHFFDYSSSAKIFRWVQQTPAGKSSATIEASTFLRSYYTTGPLSFIPIVEIEDVVATFRVYEKATQPTIETVFSSPGTEIASESYPAGGENVKLTGISVTAGDWITIAVAATFPVVCPFVIPAVSLRIDIIRQAFSNNIDIGYS
jgi:hypothetical protein